MNLIQRGELFKHEEQVYSTKHSVTVVKLECEFNTFKEVFCHKLNEIPEFIDIPDAENLFCIITELDRINIEALNLKLGNSTIYNLSKDLFQLTLAVYNECF